MISSRPGDAGSPSRSLRAFDAVDIAATAVFGFEGAAAAAEAGFDILGSLVVGFIVALAGGIIRDVLLGDAPPAAFRSPARIVAALGAGLLAFIATATVASLPSSVLDVLDAVGLALFAVAGAQKATERGANLWVATMLGGVTATGGGLIRDVLLDRTPYVLSESVYGTAALAGAITAAWLLRREERMGVALTAGFAVAFLLRLFAMAFGWELPRITPAA